MHEQSLMNNLMDKILNLAKSEKATRVTKISVKLGALSHMSPEHFKEHFDISARGTIAEEAEIDAIVCDDLDDPQAQSIVLVSIDVSE